MKPLPILMGFVGGVVIAKVLFGVPAVRTHLVEPLFNAIQRDSVSLVEEVDAEGFQ